MKDLQINHLLLLTLNWKDFPGFYGEEKHCLFTVLWFFNAPLVFLDFKKEHRRQFIQLKGTGTERRLPLKMISKTVWKK